MKFDLAMFITLFTWREKRGQQKKRIREIISCNCIFKTIYQQVCPLISLSVLLPCVSLVSTDRYIKKKSSVQ